MTGVFFNKICQRSLLPCVLLVVGISALLLCDVVWSFADAGDSVARDVEPFRREVKIVAVGDIMMHMAEVDAAYRKEQNDYSFEPFFSAVTPLIRNADIALANLETTFTNDRKYTGYPNFNSPKQLAGDLKMVGFDLLVTANNHALDYGETGVLNTLEVLSRAGLQAVGTNAGRNEQGPRIIEKNGIRLAFVAYTCLSNGHVAPPEKNYLLNLFSFDRVRQDIAQARKGGADLIVCYIHFGTEYERYPSLLQSEIVAFLQSQGVNIVFGSHPHVVQPGLFRKNENTYVIYSLGNFISDQHSNYTDVGLIVEIEIVKSGKEKAFIENVEYHPTYVVSRWVNKKPTYKIKLARDIDSSLTRKYSDKQLYDKKSFYQDMMFHLENGLENKSLYAPNSPSAAQSVLNEVSAK